MASQEEYAIDFGTPPVISRLPNLSWRLGIKRRTGVRSPSSSFLQSRRGDIWLEEVEDVEGESDDDEE